MKRLLIANRGEIVGRIARTAREIGIETVAVASSEDTALAEGYGTDRIVRLDASGPAAYLDIARLIDVAREERCQAIHPGYGFLSERAEFARASEAADLVFIGPRPETLELFGDKGRARSLAEGLGIPVVPGLSVASTLEEVEAFFDRRDGSRDGKAILLKAVAGGGGRGMRRVDRRADLANAYARCRSEAERAFGQADLIAEALIEPARHIEVQILGDGRGQISHLWERDCSAQRRHQKVIEVAPAPALDPAIRERLITWALALGHETKFRGLGTIEFLVEQPGTPDAPAYFIEANPRLQVEHTVTEEVTDLDLVELQLLIAAGASLEDLGRLEPPAIRGFAIELRILAESIDDRGEIRPSTEAVTRFSGPSGAGLRVDSVFGVGHAPSPAFDSLLAKLVVSTRQDDWPRCVERARRALDDFEIAGPRTNLRWLHAVLSQPEFRAGTIDVRFLERHGDRVAERLETDPEFVDRPGNAANRAAEDGRNGSGSLGEADALADDAIAIRSPLIATVLEVAVAPGDSIDAGDPLCVLESMKMEHVIESPAEGRVESVRVAPGAVVQETQLLATLVPSGESASRRTAARSVDLDFVRSDLAEVQARHALLEDESRPEAVERRRSRGQRTARENLASLCDDDSFSEYGALAVAAMRKVRPIEELERKTPGDAIITGFGTVNADLFGSEAARCAVLVVDATVLAGTQGFFHHHKIDRILELAERAGTPVVFYPEGGGGRPNDTDASDVFVAGLNVTSFHAFAKLSGKVPRVSIVSGFCFAGSAAFAGCADVIIATRNTSLGMGGPAMIEGGGLGVHAPEDVGPSSVQSANGVIDVLVEDEEEAAAVARRYLAYFQGPLDEWSCEDPRRLRQLIPENRRRVYDVRQVIETLCDTDSVLELRAGWGPGIITSLVRIEGRPMGLVANDPAHLGGAIDDEGAEKAARFLQLCDAFGLPILSLCDTPGFMVGPEIEAKAQVRKVSRLFVVGANLSVPLFCVILRKGYGLGAQAMAGGSFVVPFEIVAWPTGEIGGMGLEGAVRLGFKKRLDALEDEAEKEALFEKLVGVMYAKGKALHAASQLEFDGVIDPAETRARISRGLRSFGPITSSGRGFVDTW